jgi:hypothetical protein
MSEVMSVRFTTPEALPYVCAVYVCRGCGHHATRHGREVAEPPPGWVEIAGGAEPEHACPGCAAEAVAEKA